MPIRCPYCLSKHLLGLYSQELKLPPSLNATSRKAGKMYICDLCAAAELIADLAGYDERVVRADIERRRKENLGKRVERVEMSFSLSPSESTSPSIEPSFSLSPSPSLEPEEEPDEYAYKPEAYIVAGDIDQSFVEEKKPEPEMTPEDYITSLRKARRKLE